MGVKRFASDNLSWDLQETWILVNAEKPIDGIRRGEIWLMDVIWASGRSVAGKWRQKLAYDEICPFCLVHHISVCHGFYYD